MAAGYQSIETKLDSLGQTADSSKKCVQDLFITDPTIDRAKLITSKGDIVSGTCDWITQKHEFAKWITSDGGLLWISGGPGLGKTMLSIYLTEYLSRYLRSLDHEPRHYSTYFFCDAKDDTRNNAVAIARGLLFQLLEQKEDLIRHILPTYEIQQDQMFRQSSFETIWKVFLQMTNDIGDSQVSCILDGLDECEPVSLQDLLQKLNKITSTSPRLKIIVLSREHPRCIEASLGQFLRIRLDPDAKAEVRDGLDLYISTRVAELSQIKQYPDDLTSHVKKKLKEKSKGTYLWVSFVVKDLQKVEVSEVEESLDRLPQGLHPLYERILEQVDPVHQGLTLDILRWCTFAVRPLTLNELASVLGMQPTSLLDKEAVLRGKLAYCGHLISISDDKISLVHQSAYDFLTRHIPDHGKVPWFSLSSVEVEHSKLASICIAYFYDVFLKDEDICRYTDRFLAMDYIQLAEKQTKERLQYPFIEYAMQQWDNHFNHSSKQGVNIMDQYPQFFSDSSIWKLWAKWKFTYTYDELLSVVADFGLTVLMQRILEEKGHWLYWKYLFSKKAKETALLSASSHGYLPIVKLLIKNGVHLDCEDSGKNTPLNSAVRGGHREVAEFLLTCGASINGVSQAQPPLIQAVSYDQSESVKLLLEWKAHDDKKSRHKWSSLRLTSKLRCALNVNCRDENGNTPLHIAALKGDTEVIQLLLTHPDVGSKEVNSWGLSPMHLALINCRSAAVQHLVQDWKMPLPKPDEDLGWGAIHFAVYFDEERFTLLEPETNRIKTLQLIIEELGVDPHFRTAKVRRPDDKWHSHQFLDVDKIFFWPHNAYYTIGHMASIKEHDSCYETALSLSIRRGNSVAMAYFLDHCKIDPNASCRGCDGATPLHVAAQSLRDDLVGILISKWKVNVNCIDRYKRTPLHVVVSAILSPRRYTKDGIAIIKMLVRAGAQLSAMDIDGNTARDIFEAQKDVNQEKEEILKSMDVMKLLTY